MDLFSLIIGIVLGASLSPFWLEVWDMLKNWVSTIMNKSEEPK